MTRRYFGGALAGCLHGQTRITISVGSSGTSTYAIAGAIAEVLGRSVPGVAASVEVMGSGSAGDTLKLLDSGRISLALNNVDIAAEALEGRLRGYTKPVAVRALALLMPAYLHIATTPRSGIRKLSEFRGRIVSTGGPAGSAEMQANRLFAACGLTARDLRRQERLSLNEAAGALKDGRIDAFFWSAGPLPVPAITDLASTPGFALRLLDHAAEAAAVVRSRPAYYLGTIPRGTYQGVSPDVPVLSTRYALMALERLDQNLVYRITRTLIERKKEWVTAHKGLGDITAKSAAEGSPIPLHDAARRYYREQGVL